MPTFYVTKYALTSGVQQVEAEEPNARYGGRMITNSRNALDGYHGEGIEWHRTPEAAFARAEEMRKAKIASLRKIIAKLEKLTFEVKP